MAFVVTARIIALLYCITNATLEVLFSSPLARLVNRFGRRRDLHHDIDAVLIIFDHALHRSPLTGNPAEAIR